LLGKIIQGCFLIITICVSLLHASQLAGEYINKDETNFKNKTDRKNNEKEVTFQDSILNTALSIEVFSEEECIKDKKYKKKVKDSFQKKDVLKNYNKWKKYDTGTYTYMYEETMGIAPVLLFVKNGKIVQGAKRESKKKHYGFPFEMRRKKDLPNYFWGNMMGYNKTIVYLNTSSRRFTFHRKIDYTLVSKRFEYLLDKNFENYCETLEFWVKYDEKYGYVSRILEDYPRCKCRTKSLESNRHSVYGLFMLPKETEYTDEIVQKILNKYEQTWKCEKKLECLDKYLVWDANESK